MKWPFVWGLLPGLAMLAAGCFPVEIDREIQLDRNAYLTPIAEARSNGLEPYWLGPSFTAVSTTYSYLEAVYPQGIAGVDVGGLEVKYHTGNGEELGLLMTTIPIAEWPMAEDLVRTPIQGKPNRNDVAINGIDADLQTYTSVIRPISSFVLIIETEQSAVVVTVPSFGSATPGGPDLNPLIDLDTFLAVMENLQPYSE
ncbi:MAG: hypothetical protein HY873_00520 [Chloroflexi bacterium]|nr:hypothetical protein [Chloroflexota bacterium]